MRKIIIAATTILFMACTISVVYADCGMCSAASAKEGEIINETCPVMGDKVDNGTPYKTEYKGKTIGFCCPACITKFKADPEKYMAKLGLKKKECMIKCPECGAAIDMMEQCKKMDTSHCSMMKAICPITKEKPVKESE
jgi:YHS domain-containing protein